MFLRLNAPDGGSNSLWIQVDGGNWIKVWKEATGVQLLTQGFEWRKVNDDSRPVTLELAAGSHTVTIANREAGTLLDKVVLSTLDALPSGFGVPASNCSSTVAVWASAGVTSPRVEATDEVRLDLFPNPTRERLTVNLYSSYEGLVTVSIIDITGRTLGGSSWIRTMSNSRLSSR